MPDTHRWQRCTPEQLAQGYLAVYVSLHTLQTDRGGVIPYENRCPVNAKQLLRRMARGDSMPYFVEYIGAQASESATVANI